MKNLRDMDILPFLPHRPPMLLVNRLLFANTQFIEAQYTITEDCLFLADDNFLETCAYIEILAQSFAVGTGYLRNKKELDVGFLATMREVKVFSKAMLGDTLNAKVSLVAELTGIIVVDGELFCGEKKIAQGQFKVYLPDVPEE